MAVHCVFISSQAKDGAAIDTALRERFDAVYRVGVEFWLVDTAHDAEELAGAMRAVLSARDKLFVAAMTRDFVPILSDAAKVWLTAPGRSFRVPARGRGLEEGGPSLFAKAA
ncbi:MAG: hypothetical protein AAF318_11465 [Pseudomonadota bacterium]